MKHTSNIGEQGPAFMISEGFFDPELLVTKPGALVPGGSQHGLAYCKPGELEALQSQLTTALKQRDEQTALAGRHKKMLGAALVYLKGCFPVLYEGNEPYYNPYQWISEAIAREAPSQALSLLRQEFIGECVADIKALFNAAEEDHTLDDVNNPDILLGRVLGLKAALQALQKENQ